MKLKHAFKIARTKFQARKVRTVLTAFITAIMLTILVSLSLGFTGLRNTFSSIPGLSSDKARAFVTELSVVYEEINADGSTTTITTDGDGNPIEAYEITNSVEKINKKYPGYNVTNLYTSKLLFESIASAESAITVNGIELPSASNGYLESDIQSESLTFNIISDQLIAEDLSDGQIIAIGQDGSIPVLVNPSALPVLAYQKVDSSNAKKTVDVMAALVKEYTGRTILVDSTGKNSSKNTLLLRIVGFTAKDSLFGYTASTNNIYIPTSQLSDDVKSRINDFYFKNFLSFSDQQIEDQGILTTNADDGSNGNNGLFFDESLSETRIFEFANKADLKRFIDKESCAKKGYGGSCVDVVIYKDALLEFDGQISAVWAFLKWVVGVLFVITAIFLFFTTSKVIADSRKETGVFRAMGASRGDIAKIYLLYTTMLTSLAFVLSCGISLILMLLVTRTQGPELSIQVTNFTGSFADVVSVSFVGINLLQLTFIWLVSVVVGLAGGAIPIASNVMTDPIKAMRTD